jgi:hypothetical protein
MSPRNEDLTRPSAVDLDRLVDGELSEERRRELLLQLERQPDGWRSCALAFLEAQSWKRDLGAVMRAPVETAQEPPTATPAAPATSWWRRHGPLVLASAASFVLAFIVSSAGRNLWQGILEAPQPQVAESTAPRQTPGGPTLDAHDASPWRVVSFDVPNAGKEGVQNVRLPAKEQDRLDEGWLHSMPAPLSDDLRRALERTGHRVQESRRLMPVPMEDGRRLVVPVDQVDVRYVGNAAYQ